MVDLALLSYYFYGTTEGESSLYALLLPFFRSVLLLDTYPTFAVFILNSLSLEEV